MDFRMIWVYILVSVALTTAYTPEGFRGTAKRFTLKANAEANMSMQKRETRDTSRAGTLAAGGFPEELRYILTLEGNTETELHLIRDNSMRIPESFQQDLTGKFTRKDVTNPQNIAFYKDLNGHGLFACQRQTSIQGQFECGISAMLNVGEETCFIGLGASNADCTSKVQDRLLYFPEPEVDNKHHTVVNARTSRNKRNILPAQGFKTVEAAYLPDAKFTDLFYRRHPGDTATAETEMMMFFTLLTNEINVYYSTLVETSSGSLNIQLYPSAVALPGYRQNFYWSENFNDGANLYATDAMKSNVEYIVNDSGFISGQFDFVFALTGFNLKDATNGGPLVSFTYLNTICTSSRKKFSVTEFTSWNLPRILAHELGHGLGAQHDDDTSCAAGVNLMSIYLFSPDAVTKDTYHYFSSCSVADIIAHLSSQSSCLDDNDFTYNEFVDSFCQGLLGQQVSSVDKQCERLTNYVGSTACDTVTEESCYLRNQIRCTDSNGDCIHKLQYLWSLTPCATDKVCYRGSCVATFDVCTTTSSSTSSTTSSTSTTLTPTTTTSTTSTTSTTTPTTTSTTTTPTTTTSTTSTTSTTTPTTTSTTTTPTTTTSTTSTSTTTPTTTSTTTTPSTTTSTTSTTSTTTPTTTSTTTTPTTTTSTTSTTSTTTPTTTSTTTTPSTTTSTTSTTSTTTPTTTSTTTTPTTTISTTSTTSTTTPTTTSTTTTPTTTTSSTTSSTTSTTSSTTSTTSSTTSAPSTTTSTTLAPTTTASVPCSCCGFKRDKRRLRCCRTAKSKIDAVCYCCFALKKVEEPSGWTGRRF